MSRRIAGAVAAVVLLGGGILAFVLLRAGSEREARIVALVGDVDTELRADARGDAESLRTLLRRLRGAAAELGDSRLEIAEGRLLLALGRPQEAWERIRPLATVPGAGLDAVSLGARVLARVHAETGDEAIGRQALAMAGEDLARSGAAAAARLAWQLAYRVGDAERFAELSAAIAGGEAADEAELVRLCAPVLAGFIADRSGLPRDALDPSAEGPAGALAAVQRGGGSPVSVAALDELALRQAEPPPELEIVAVTRLLDEYGSLAADQARGGRAEDLLRDAQRRIESVLGRTPSNCDARHLAVVTLIGLRQSFGLDPESLGRYRGHLDWLTRSAPAQHTQRRLWQALRDELGR